MILPFTLSSRLGKSLTIDQNTSMTLKKEQIIWQQGYLKVAGFDEVGRGAWAGPLVAGAVILSADFLIQNYSWANLVKDSKIILSEKREEIFEMAKSSIVWAVGVVEPAEIDRFGLGDANREAMRRAMRNLPQKPDYIFSDFVFNAEKIFPSTPFEAIIDGDSKIFCVALASIMAKVYRDRMMIDYAREFTGYGFANNKGYGTPEHIVAIAKTGLCRLHRRSFEPIRKVERLKVIQ